MKQYHTLLVRDSVDSDWAVHFGDYDLSVVREERRDITEGPSRDYRRNDTKIITTDDDQKSIEEAVRVQNIRFG